MAFNDSSDYGSDFTPEEEELLNELLANVATQHAATTRSATATIVESAADSQEQNLQPTLLVGDIEDYEEHPKSPRTPKKLGREKCIPPWAGTQQNRTAPLHWIPGAASQVAGDPRTATASTREQQWTRIIQNTASQDVRSPIERFRQPPNKALSVTDLVSPAWCELQYWYTLTKHGRKRRTAAMKLGSTVHKTLEDEVHTTVPVEITTKEDAWALRIWNVIQGLRTLREFGMTRELEIWGLIDGEIVNGVIDQLSYECPDPELEASAAAYYADAETARAALPEYQMSLSDYLLSPSRGGKKLSDLAWSEPEQSEAASAVEQPPADTNKIREAYNIPRIYMTDIKTRASRSIPTVSSTSFRPTLLQLQIYYHMLNRLTTSDDVTIEALALRYALDPERSFTDDFVLEVGGLNDQFFDVLSSQESEKDSDYVPSASQNSTSILLAHNNLTSLWNLMKEQLRLTFLPPEHTSSSSSPLISPSIPSPTQPRTLELYPTVLSPLLTAKYISSAPTTEEEPSPVVLGSRSFLFDPAVLTSYVSDQMTWWRGQRDPRGVEVMDAWKCRICEFKDECSWREEKERAFAGRRRRRREGEAKEGGAEGGCIRGKYGGGGDGVSKDLGT
ncbi:hypothetical protein VTN00DRAFT_9369 [Thermoascus crustaceus]|uniref:uncharacterized protein n=1 Tax=Thermoascus crustaceus TaxID=5088 RepID=UPI0037422886